jgi:acyl-CoA reductase-like NAD-dependent aldehyde dehydrogenase
MSHWSMLDIVILQWPCRVAQDFHGKLKARAEAIKKGDPLEPGCRMGPIVCESQYKRVMSYVQVGKGKGAGVMEVAGARLSAQRNVK